MSLSIESLLKIFFGITEAIPHVNQQRKERQQDKRRRHVPCAKALSAHWFLRHASQTGGAASQSTQ